MECRQPDFENLAYGPHERNTLDLWLAPRRPAPLVVAIHGGGWIGKNKEKYRQGAWVPLFLEAGISVAAINYRFTIHAPMPAPMLDTARAVQFLRLHAGDWGIDPERIGATGSSAGGVNALWVAFHEDLANPADRDPVARQSSRLSCVFAVKTPAFLDVRSIAEKIPIRIEEQLPLLKSLGGAGAGGAEDPRAEQIRREISPLYLAAAGAPPVSLFYTGSDADRPPDGEPDQGMHHPRFGRILKRRLDDLGVECDFRCRDDYPGCTPEQFQECWREAAAGFLSNKLGAG